MTIYLHEVHRVAGASEDDFEAAFREPGGWMERLAAGDDARLLYYLNQAHGSGPSYRVVTITAIADGAAWERVARDAALTAWSLDVDRLRHDVTSKLLLPVEWSPMVDVDLATVPVTPQEHEPTLFMEDTGWPYAPLDAYTDFWGRDYHPMLSRQPEATRLLEIQACWITALGRRPEAILWQRIHNLDRLLALLTSEVPPEYKTAGTYMAKGLEYRDQWESRLLRTAPWSPWA
jgi:hypothetical protein